MEKGKDEGDNSGGAEEDALADNPLHIFTLGAKAPLALRRSTVVHSGLAGGGSRHRGSGFISVLGKNSGSVPNIAEDAVSDDQVDSIFSKSGSVHAASYLSEFFSLK